MGCIVTKVEQNKHTKKPKKHRWILANWKQKKDIYIYLQLRDKLKTSHRGIFES